MYEKIISVLNLVLIESPKQFLFLRNGENKCLRDFAST